MDLESQVKVLKEESVSLRKQITILKIMLKRQNDMLKTVSKASTKYRFDAKALARFPIKSQEDLDEFEKSISSENKSDLVRVIRNLINGYTLARNMHRILSTNIILEYNIEGVHQKRRLNDYPRLMSLLYEVTDRGSDWNEEKFISDLRGGLTAAKKRHFQRVSATKRKSKEFN